jgi:translocation and assembly module TamB
MPRALKIPLWIIGSLLLLAALLLIAVLVIGNTESGRALIVRMTSRMTDGRVAISGIHGSFPAALDLDKLQLRDDRGVWLIAEHTSLRWSPMALIARHVEVESLRIRRLRIERAPVSKPETKPSSGPISIPRSDLAQLDIDTLELGQALAGTQTAVTLHGNAHWRSLQDAVASLRAQRTNGWPMGPPGRGNYEANLRLNADRIDATVKLQEPADGPLENLLQLPGLGDLSMLAQLSGPRTAENLTLTLDAGALKGRVKGTLNLKAQSGDLDYVITASAMTPRPDLSWQSVDIHGSWQGTVSSPEAQGNLLIRQLQIPGGTQLANLTAELTASAGALNARATLEGLIIPGSEPTLFRDAPLTLAASANLNDPQRPVDITAAHRLFALQAHAVTTGEQSAQLDLHLPDLAPLAAVANEKVKGNATLKARVTRTSRATKLTTDIDANLDGGTASWAGLVRGGNTRLQLAGAMTDTKITVDKLDLTGRALSVGASGSIARSATPNLDVRVNVNLPDLKQILPTTAGTLKLSARVNGPSTALNTSADLTSTLSIHGSPQGTVTASVRAEGLPKAPRGTIEAHGDLDGAPLVLNVALERDKDLIHAIVRRADWKSAHIEADISSGKEISQARGHMLLRMGQLADLDRLLGSTLQGSVAGNIRLIPAPHRSQAQIDLEAHDVVTSGITANGKLTAAGAMDALAIQLEAQSPAIGGSPASINSTATLNTVASEVHLRSLEAKYHDQALKLLNPTKVSYANGLAIYELKVGIQEAILELDGRLSPTLDARASLQQVKPALINAFVPKLLAAGTIQGNAQIQGSPTAPHGKLHLEAIGLRSSSDLAAGLPAADFHADANLTGNTASIDAKVKAGNASHLELSGQAPLAANGNLDLKLGGTLDVGLLNPIAEASGKHVTGALTIDTAVTGTQADPKIDGTVRLADGSMRDYTQGINLTDITGTLVGGHGTLQIQELKAKAAPGEVSLSGTIGVLQPHVPVDIKLTAKNAQPISSNIITANVNADIEVSGTAREQLDVKGKVDINRTTVQIPSSFPPDVAVLDVRRPGETPPPPPEKPLIINLDITVDAPRQVLVKGRGLDAEMGGEIHIRGTSATPRVGGSFDLQRGTFALGTSHLNFTQGTVTFNGQGLQKRIDPTLNFVAETRAADVTATVKITGLADSPKIELSSTPELPQDEIMARLLFGESASQLSALQVVQIGAALAQLGGGGGGFNPLTKIQKTLGLDRLTVGSSSTSGNSGTTGSANNQPSTGYSVEAGRYVSSRVFVAVKESSGGFTQVAVDVDLTRRLKLQTRLGNGTATTQGTTPENDPGSSIGLAYQFEY